SMGRQEIERLMQEARDLGIIISRENIDRFVQYDAVLGRWRATMRGLRNEVAIAVLPILSLVAQRGTEGVQAFGQWVRENRALVAQATIVTGALLAFALGLKTVSTAILVVSRGIGLLVSLIGFLTSPIGLVVAALATLWVAWDRNWGDIQGRTETAVNFIREQWDRLTQWWDESEVGQSIRDWWNRVLEVWNSGELNLPEKAVEIAKLTPGARWIVGFVEDVKSIWADEELTLPEKVVEITRLIPGVKAIEDMIGEIREVWAREDLTLPEKITETFKVIANRVDVEAGDLAFALGAAITAPYILDKIADAIKLVPGLVALTLPGNILRIGIAGMILALGVYGWRLWNALKEGEEELKAEAERITSEALAAGIEIGLAVNAIRWTILQAAGIREALLTALAGTGTFALVVQAGVTMLNLIGALTVGLTVATAVAYAYMSDEEKEALK